jgi:hypothetical protein
LDDLVGHGVGEGDVRADVVAEPDVGPLGGLRTAGIDDEEPRTVVNALEDVMEEDRMCVAGIRAPQQDDVGVVILLVRGSSATRSKDRRQTDDARSVSSPVT